MATGVSSNLSLNGLLYLCSVQQVVSALTRELHSLNKPGYVMESGRSFTYELSSRTSGFNSHAGNEEKDSVWLAWQNSGRTVSVHTSNGCCNAAARYR